MNNSNVDPENILQPKYIKSIRVGGKMHQAVIVNNINVLKSFIKRGVKVNIVDKENKVPIAYVKDNSQLDILDILLAAGSSIYKCDVYGKMQFYDAFKFGNENVIKKFLEYKINLNIADSNGQTAIHYLMENRCYDIEYVLENSDFDVDVEDLSGQTPLFLAIKKRNLHWVRFLLRKGANANYENKDKSTPLFAIVNTYCCRQCTDLESQCVKLLIEKGADVNRLFYSCDTILEKAFFKHDFKIVKSILKRLAVTEACGSSIVESDRMAIKRNRQEKYYFELKDELQMMMKLKYHTNVCYFKILNEENTNMLAKYIHRIRSQEIFENNLKYFPHYSKILRRKYTIGTKMLEEQISKKEEELCEIFYLYFPPHIIRNIAVHCSFDDINL